ncbi:hypothetical protein WDW86_08860 [Bdellovibrionota bacterium FG-2]
MSFRREKKRLADVVDMLLEIEDCFESGLVPTDGQWARLGQLPAPWGRLSSQSLIELRRNGAPILPTLKRFRALAVQNQADLGEAQGRSAQAIMQAGFSVVLVPVFGSILFLILPGVSAHPWLWLMAGIVSIMFSLVGAFWMLKMADAARWGGLTSEKRTWVLAAQCGGERFLSLVRSGSPPDLAWNETLNLLRDQAPPLALVWGNSLWSASSKGETGFGREGLCEKSIAQAGAALKRGIQVSLMEGRSCVERVESVLISLREDLRSHVSRELSLLATRALKPLFLFVAPSLIGLLIFGLWITAREVSH